MIFTTVNGKNTHTSVIVSPAPDAWNMEITYPYSPELAPVTTTHSTEGMTDWERMRELDRIVAETVKDREQPRYVLRWLGQAYLVEYATH